MPASGWFNQHVLGRSVWNPVGDTQGIMPWSLSCKWINREEWTVASQAMSNPVRESERCHSPISRPRKRKARKKKKDEVEVTPP